MSAKRQWMKDIQTGQITKKTVKVTEEITAPGMAIFPACLRRNSCRSRDKISETDEGALLLCYACMQAYAGPASIVSAPNCCSKCTLELCFLSGMK